MRKKLSDFSTLTFDCYGTLIDWESGIWDAFQPLLRANGRSDITRYVGLEAFAVIEHAQQAETPGMLYPEILTRVHRGLAEQFNLTTNADMDRAFGALVPQWPAFPDTADALRILKQHFNLVILSNVNRDGFAASNRKLGVAFDAVYTAENVGSYKPDPRNFQYLIEHLDADLAVSKDKILHTGQSLFHDHVPAREAGLARAWVDRQGIMEGGSHGATLPVGERPEVDFFFPTLIEMAEAVASAG